MLKAFIVILIGLIGLIIGITLQTGQDGNTSRQATSKINDTNNKAILDIKQQLQKLTTQLDQATQERAANLQHIKQLDQKLTLLEAKYGMGNKQKNAQSIQKEAVKNGKNSDSNNDSSTSETQSIAAILTKIGIDPVTIENIEKSDEKNQMKQLYLRNRAIREGWFGTEKYFNKTRELEKKTSGLREELGDSKYDEYLYASGKFNRIKVSSIFSSSPAEQSGILAGDVIYSYDGKRVFNWSDLTTLTTQGKVGEPVDVQIIRDNVLSDLAIPRGPMGIRLQSVSIDPKTENQ